MPIACNDATFNRIHEAELDDRILTLAEKDRGLVPDTCSGMTTKELAEVGHAVRIDLGLSRDNCYGFPSARQFTIGLGTFVQSEEVRYDGVAWRSHGRKTIVEDLSGELAVIRQFDTSGERIVCRERDARTAWFGWPSWSDILGLSLAYFAMSHPGEDVLPHVDEHLLSNGPVLLYGEQFRPEHFGTGQRQADQEPVLSSWQEYELSCLFRDGIPEIAVNTEATQVHCLVGYHRPYFAFTYQDDLHIGIRNSDMLPLEENRAGQFFRATYGGKKFVLRDWIRFRPDDATRLLCASAEHYARDKQEAREVVDLYVSGMWEETSAA